MDSMDEAKAIERALEHVPESDRARLILEVDLAHALTKVGRMYEAVTRLRQLEGDPQLSPKQHDTLGSAFAKAGLFDDALKHCEAAVAGAPDYVPGVYNYATTLRYLGRFDESEAAFERALALAPQHYLSYASLAVTKKWTPEHNHIARMRAEFGRVERGSEDEAHLHYALFKELHDIKAPAEEAWRALEAGAEICRKLYPFSLENQAAGINAAISTFTKERLAQRSTHTPPAPHPIFIVGLPRSGTTLTERILAAHSKVTAMGETVGMPRAILEGLQVSRRHDDLDADAILRSASLDWAAVAATYQRETSFLSAGADIVTEKLPPNYKAVGQISLAFPDAPIVHVRRGPMDSLFGAYKLMFGKDSYAWSYGQAELAANYRLYRKLMQHWRDALGERLHVVTLEHLIEQPEREIRKLLDFCRLPFEEACLSPHEAEGGVSTASSTQVRSPINREGVGAWRRYATQLEPLRAALERDGFVDGNGDPIWD
jgi:tetratricopeptide (TPR) repeat protein